MIKAKTIIVVLLIVVLIAVNRKTVVFVGEKDIVDHLLLESPILLNTEFVSCQADCTLFDDEFHDECIGYNGCEDSKFLRNKVFCEKDDDCVINLGCCSKICSDKDCFNVQHCAVANDEYVSSHKLSCGNIQCSKEELCKESEYICQNNVCRISI